MFGLVYHVGNIQTLFTRTYFQAALPLVPGTRTHTTRSTTFSIAGRQGGELQPSSVWTSPGCVVVGQLGVADGHMGQ